MHLVTGMRYQTSIYWDAARRRLVVGYRILKQPVRPTLEGSSTSSLVVPKRRLTNINLCRTTRQVGAPTRSIIRRPVKTIFFKLLRPRIGLANSSEGACTNCGIFSDKLFRVWKPEFISTIFSIISATSQRP